MFSLFEVKALSHSKVFLGCFTWVWKLYFNIQQTNWENKCNWNSKYLSILNRKLRFLSECMCILCTVTCAGVYPFGFATIDYISLSEEHESEQFSFLWIPRYWVSQTNVNLKILQNSSSIFLSVAERLH